jgi:hypothetical protein
MNAKEMIMKRSTFGKTFAIAAITALALGITPTAKADDKGCSNATLQGTFAFTSTGFITAPPVIAGPFAEVGTQTFDGRGGTTITATASQNGNIAQLTLTGTYTVNSDCTGNVTAQGMTAPQAGSPPISLTLHLFFVIDNNGSEFQGIETDTGFVITRIARRLSTGRNI